MPVNSGPVCTALPRVGAGERRLLPFAGVGMPRKRQKTRKCRPSRDD